MVLINKTDIYPKGGAEIERYCLDKGIEIIGQIPFDLNVTRAMIQGLPVTAYRPETPASFALMSIWERVCSSIFRNNL